MLSEEAADDKSRLTARRVWIIDPLDGTREFSEPPRDDWAVHVALWEDGDLVAGAVAQPALGETFHTGRPSVVPPRTSERPRIAVSRSRPPAFVEALAAELDAELVPMGSAGVKVMSVVRDIADAYVHAGGQYQWDNAAPVAVARAAGLHCSRVDGSPLVYNEDDTSLPDLIVCRPELADAIVDFVRRHGTELSAMTSFVSHTTVDCHNAYELSEWWKALLGYVDVEGDPNEPGHEECMILDPDTGHAILFIEVPDAGAAGQADPLRPAPARGHPRRGGRAGARAWAPRRSPTSAASTAPAPAGWSSPTPRATSSASCARRPRSTPDAAARADD